MGTSNKNRNTTIGTLFIPSTYKSELCFYKKIHYWKSHKWKYINKL